MSEPARHYRHLTAAERYHIQLQHAKGATAADIASDLQRHRATIYRELRRNSNGHRYQAEEAQKYCCERRQGARKHSKIRPVHAQLIEKKLCDGWSPQALSLRMKLETPGIALSHTTIYRRVKQDRDAGGTLYRELPRKGRKRVSGGKRHAGKSLIPDRTDITERPAVAGNRGRRGDWEGDTINGKDAHLVTLTDRFSRLILIGKVPDKKADTVSAKLQQMLRGKKSHTLTLDNGGEFAAHAQVAAATGAKIYFAAPYASWQRGTNENGNGIIRRGWPKKMSLGQLTEREIREREMMINTMPRKMFNGLTSLEVHYRKRVALIV